MDAVGVTGIGRCTDAAVGRSEWAFERGSLGKVSKRKKRWEKSVRDPDGCAGSGRRGRYLRGSGQLPACVGRVRRRGGMRSGTTWTRPSLSGSEGGSQGACAC